MPNTVSKIVFQDYDIQSGTVVYPRLSAPRQGGGAIETSGSSTTVTAVVAGSLPFALLGVGDMIMIRGKDGVVSRRNITAKASGDSVTVNSAIDLTGGFHFEWRDLDTTGAGIDVTGMDALQVHLDWLTDNSTSITWSIDGQLHGDSTGLWANLYTSPAVVTAIGAVVVSLNNPVSKIRVGILTDTPTAAQKVSAYVLGLIYNG